MDFLKSWIKISSAKTVDEAPSEVVQEARPERPQVVIEEVAFDESHTEEAELSWLFKEYEQARRLDALYCKEALRNFFERFLEVFEPWTPIERTTAVSAAHDTVHAAVGCRAGHPSSTLAAIVEAVERISTDFGRARDWESDSPEQLEKEVSLTALDVLRIASRSRSNRAQLLSLGILPSLTRLMKVGLLRLTALAAKLAPSSSATSGSRLMLWFLQCLLAHCLSAINTLVAGEVQSVLGPRPDVMDRYLGKGASFCSRQAREPGNKAEAEAMEAALAPVLDEEVLSQVLELLRLLRALRCRGGDVIAAWEALPLECLLMLMAASGRAQSALQDGGRNGVLTIVEGLGWPTSKPETIEGAQQWHTSPVLRGSSQRSAEDELRYQTLTLQVVAAATQGCPANLQAMHDHHGFQRVTQFLQWAALTFPSRQELSHPPSTPEASTPALGRPPSPFPVPSRSSADASAPQASYPASPGRWVDSGGQRASRGSQQAELANNRSSIISTPRSPPYADAAERSLSRSTSRRSSDAGKDRDVRMLPGRSRSLQRRVSTGFERHPKAQSSRLERHSTSGAESQLSHRSEASQSLQRNSPTMSLSGSMRWPSGDWHGKLFRSMRSKIEAAIDPQEPVGAQPLGNLAQAGQPALPSPALSQAFGVCEAWLRLSQVIIPGNPDDPPHRKEIVKGVIGAIIGAYKPDLEGAGLQKDAGALHEAALEVLTSTNCALQMHTLRLLERLLAVDYSALSLLRELDLWGVIYSSAFFGFAESQVGTGGSVLQTQGSSLLPADTNSAAESSGGMSSQALDVVIVPDEAAGVVSLTLSCKAPPRQRSITNGQSLIAALEQEELAAKGDATAQQPSKPLSVLCKRDASHGRSSELGELLQKRMAVRQGVVMLTERAACMDYSENNDAEVQKLLSLLAEHALEPDVVLLAAPALASVLGAAQDITLSALDRADGLAVLGTVVAQQAEAAVPVPTRARFAVLSAMDTYLHASPTVQRAAVRRWQPIAAIFALLWDEAMRKVALSMVLRLMRLAPAEEADRQAKAALYTKYAELLPAALMAGAPDSLQLVTDLLNGIKIVIAANIVPHQNLFRSAECFVQVVNLLNFEYQGGEGLQLAEKVLSTLAALLRGNEASRRRLVSDVGYDQILMAVRRQVPAGQSLQSLLLALLELILEANYNADLRDQIIRNPEAIPLFFHFLRQADEALQSWGLSAWLSLVAGNMPNLSACDRCGLNGILIEWFATARGDVKLQEQIAALLQVTASYSITGRDLRAIFALLRKDSSGRIPQRSVLLLLRSLTAMARHLGPTTFFNFADDGAGIMRNTPLRFPGGKGFSFATWLRLEDATCQPGTCGRSLFNLIHRSPEEVRGLSVAMKGGRIVVRCMGAKSSEVELEHSFKARKWYHVALTLSSGSALTPGWARLYVDGLLEASERFKYPKVSEPLNSCTFAVRLPASEVGLPLPLSAFKGQMGCIYLFEDLLSSAQVTALHALGPDYQSTFSTLETDAALDQVPAAAVLVTEGKDSLEARLLLSYNAQAAAGRMLYNTAEMEKGNAGDGDTVAILEGTQLCCTRQLRDLLHCLGGITVLLPLFAQLDAPSSEAGGTETSRAVDAVRLLGAVLEDSPHNRQSMVQISGIALVAHLLQQRQPKHLTIDLLHAMEALLRAVGPSEGLHTAVLQRLLLNLRLWAAAPLPIQRSFQALLLKLAKGEPAGVAALLGVPRLLDAMRAHYGTAPSPDAARPPACGGGLLPAELRALRQGLLNTALSLLLHSAVPHHKATRIATDDIQALMAFIGDCPDVAMLEDVLIAVLDLLRHTPPGRIPLLAGMSGAQLFVSLLSREQPALRILGLHLLAHFVPYIQSGPGGESALAGFWSAAGDALLMFPLSRTVRESLVQLACASMAQQGSAAASIRGSQGLQMRPREGATITSAPVVGILLQLLLGCDDAAERNATLEALHCLIVDGPKENRAAVISEEGWEEWLLELLLDGSPCILSAEEQVAKEPSNGERGGFAPWVWVGAEAVLIRGIFGALNGYCISDVPRGWAALERIAGYLRAYQERGVVDGWGLLHSLLADVIADVVGAASKEAASASAAERDAWTLIASLATEPARENCMGLLDLLDELTAGTLIMPRGHALNPTEEAVAWADSEAEQVPVEAWPVLGVPGASADTSLPIDAYMTGETWRLHSMAWQLIYTLQKTLGGLTGTFWEARSRMASVRNLSSAASSDSRRVSGSGEQSALSSPRDLARPGSAAHLQENGTSGTVRAVPEEVIRRGAADRVARLALRLAVTALRCAAPSVASDCCASTCRLLSGILRSPPVSRTPSRYAAEGDPSKSPHSADRARMHLLFACLVKLNARLRTGRKGALGHARQLALAKAMHDFSEVARNALPSDTESFPTLPDPLDGQFWEKARQAISWPEAAAAARRETLFLHHMALTHAASLDQLEAEGERRHLYERARRTEFVTNAREALGAICTAERARRAAARVAHEEETQALARTWRNLQRSLSGERGLWADAASCEALHWKLDKTEDPSRRRMRLKRNYKFHMYEDSVKGQAPSTEQDAAAALQAHLPLPGVKLKGPDDEEEDFEEPMSSPQNSLVIPSEASLGDSSGLEGEQDAMSADALAEDERTAEAAASLKDESQVIYSCSCQLVLPKHAVSGTMRLTALHVHFIGEVQQPPDECGASVPRPVRTHKRWPLVQLAELHHSRFLLQPSALELFLADRTTALLCFGSSEGMLEAAEKLAAASPRTVVYDKKRKAELAAKLAQRWQRWELSNFDYLMQLNVLAGRTYNDLNQYPVFPWILADYTSDTLDLNDPAMFRDLSKPVGALEEKRLAFFRERYQSMLAESDIPAFHYGSHYSAAGTVLFYLIRLEPFTRLNRNLQGGRFDHADRLFASVAAAWQNCLVNSSDVKELTPEFFYLPNFLVNADGFQLGQRQDGTALGDVELPPWAQGSPDEFVRLQREALESDHVSEHLHDWIDLIFGFKQRGKAAEAADNVFYYLTYEGTVNLQEIEDPQQRTAVEDQISHFGQTPSQLFRRKHPKRGPPPPPSIHPLLNGPDAMKLSLVGMPPSRRPNIAVARLEVTEGRVVLVNSDRAVSTHRWLSPKDAGAFTFSVPAEAGYGVEADPNPPRLMGAPFAVDLHAQHCYAILPGGQVVVCCGYWDNSIRCYSSEEGRLLQSVRVHKDIVTCIEVGSDGRTLASGSRDTTLIIWDIVDISRSGGRLRRSGPPGASLQLQPAPRHVLHGHEDAVTCLALSPELDLIVSASADGTLLFHTLGTGRYVRKLRLQGGAPPTLLAIAPGPGMLVAHSWADLGLHVFNINGEHLVSSAGNERLSALAVTASGHFLLTGGLRGVVSLQWLHSLELVIRYDGARGPVTALSVTAEECIVAGTLNGALLVFSPDPRRRISRRLQLAAARSGPVANSPSASPSKTLNFSS